MRQCFDPISQVYSKTHTLGVICIRGFICHTWKILFKMFVVYSRKTFTTLVRFTPSAWVCTASEWSCFTLQLIKYFHEKMKNKVCSPSYTLLLFFYQAVQTLHSLHQQGEESEVTLWVTEVECKIKTTGSKQSFLPAAITLCLTSVAISANANCYWHCGTVCKCIMLTIVFFML